MGGRGARAARASLWRAAFPTCCRQGRERREGRLPPLPLQPTPPANRGLKAGRTIWRTEYEGEAIGGIKQEVSALGGASQPPPTPSEGVPAARALI